MIRLRAHAPYVKLTRLIPEPEPEYKPRKLHDQRSNYSEAEDAVLRGFYKKSETWLIAQRLGRTVKSVHARAHKLGLRQKGRGRVTRLAAESP